MLDLVCLDGEDLGPPRVLQRDNFAIAISRGRINTVNDVRPLVTRDLILLDR